MPCLNIQNSLPPSLCVSVSHVFQPLFIHILNCLFRPLTSISFTALVHTTVFTALYISVLMAQNIHRTFCHSLSCVYLRMLIRGVAMCLYSREGG